MTKINEIYKCEICGNVVEVLDNGVGELVCCGQPMKLLEIQTEGEVAPKHVPVVNVDGNTVTVEVGEVTHPMVDDHSIRFIELDLGDEKFVAELKPGEEPKATFVVDEDLLNNNDVVVKEYCNVHGLWSN